MGGERSVTSWHADHYENLYAVITGSKTFYLMPPADAWRMRMRRAPVFRWELRDNDDDSILSSSPAWKLIPVADDSSQAGNGAAVFQAQTVWSSRTVPDGLIEHSETSTAHCEQQDGESGEDNLPPPLVVTLHLGETLYLPAGWWHAVRQGPRTIAVNYWHDQHWGAGEAFATAVQSLAVEAGLCEPPPTREAL